MKIYIKKGLCLLSSILIFIFCFQNLININDKNNLRILKEESESEVLHLIKFNFETTHNPDEKNDPISNLILNDVRIPINVGTPNQKVLASLRFNDYLFFLSTPYIDLEQWQDKSNIFNKDSSFSYKFIASDSLFYKSILTKAERANETFYFENKELTIKNLTFYYATKMSFNQSGGVVGLCLEDSNMNLHSGMNFLTQLKLKKAISYKT